MVYYGPDQHSIICQNLRSKKLHKRKRQSPVSVGIAGEASLIADWDFIRRVAALQTSKGESVARRMQASQPDRKDNSQVVGIFDLDGKEVADPAGMVWWGLVAGDTAPAAGPRAVIRPVRANAQPVRRANARRLKQGHVAAKVQQLPAT